ncbi:MAG: molecular chaperone [Candidatus Binatia bacterium]
MRSRHILLAAGAVLGAWFGPRAEALGSSFQVTPISIALSAREPSAVLTIHNESADSLRFQASVFSWRHDGAGEPVLSETQDVVCFPSLLAVAPGARAHLRVGTVIAAEAVEKAYRVFIEELPRANDGTSARPREHAITILTRMGIPVFLAPAGGSALAQASIADMAFERGVLSFALRNPGAVHFRALSVQVRGVGASGAPTFQRESAGGYILAGESRPYRLEIPPAERCATAAVVIRISTAGAPVERRVELPHQPCT